MHSPGIKSPCQLQPFACKKKIHILMLPFLGWECAKKLFKALNTLIYIKAAIHGPSKHSCNSQMLAPDKSPGSYAVVVRLVLEARY